nr:MAG TPA: hypothetical protein [Microviridae sp.]
MSFFCDFIPSSSLYFYLFEVVPNIHFRISSSLGYSVTG